MHYSKDCPEASWQESMRNGKRGKKGIKKDNEKEKKEEIKKERSERTIIAWRESKEVEKNKIPQSHIKHAKLSGFGGLKVQNRLDFCVE